MSQPVRFSVLLGLVVVATAAAVPTAASARASRPGAKLTVPAQSDEKQPIPFQWSVSRLPAKATVVLQRPFGTAKVWRTITRLQGLGGSATAPAFALGTYQVRLAVIDRRKKLLATKSATLHVFGNVPLGQLMGAQPSTYTAPTFSFTYVVNIVRTTGTEIVGLQVSAASNRCRSVHLEWVPYSFDPGPPDQQTQLSVVQETADATTAIGRKDQLATLDAEVVPKRSWSITQPGLNGVRINAYVNGTANCESADPF